MNKSLFKKVVATAMTFGMVATAFTTASFADGTTSTVTGTSNVTGGTITYAPIPITLNGSQTFGTADWAISDVIDARGTGAGWQILLTVTPFKEFDGTAYVDEGKELEARSLTVEKAPIVSKVDPTSSPENTITPIAKNKELDTGSPELLLDAAKGGGMGSFSFTDMKVKLTVPANAYAKSYKTDATIILNEAP